MYLRSLVCHAPAVSIASPIGERWRSSSAGVSARSAVLPTHRGVSSFPAGGSSLRAVAARSAQAVDSDERTRTSKFFEVELKVRDYELDQYGVVNNAVYASYCQHGRHELLQSIGISADAIARTGNSLAISEFHLKFMAPLRSQDRFVVKVRLAGFSSARIFVEHFINRLPDQEPILEATCIVVCLNQSYRPTRVPVELSSKLSEFFLSEDPT